MYEGASQYTATPQPTAEQRVQPVASRGFAPRRLGVLARRALPLELRDSVSAASTNCVWNSMRTGASAEDRTISVSTLSVEAQPRRRSARRRAPARGSPPRIFGVKRTPAVASTNMRVECRSHSGQFGKSWRGCDEVLRADHRVDEDERARQHQREQPQRRRDVGHHARHEDGAMRRVQAVPQEHPRR